MEATAVGGEEESKKVHKLNLKRSKLIERIRTGVTLHGLLNKRKHNFKLQYYNVLHILERNYPLVDGRKQKTVTTHLHTAMIRVHTYTKSKKKTYRHDISRTRKIII